MIRIREFDGTKFVEHTARSIRKLKYLIYNLKKDFRRNNNSDLFEFDRGYEEYSNSLDKILEKTIESHLGADAKCSKCAPEDHDGELCKCESRNSRILELICQDLPEG